MARIIIGATGSVASLKIPELYSMLTVAGHDVRVVATQAATYFFDPRVIAPSLANGFGRRNAELVILDEDEWPKRNQGGLYERSDEVLHIELRRWADLLLIAPLDANTLGKIANGLADNCLTCLWRAWDIQKPCLLAPAMNTLMWEHPSTIRQWQAIAQDAGVKIDDIPRQNAALMAAINEQSHWLRVIPPIAKRLACDDIGMGAMAEIGVLHEAVEKELA